MLQSIDPREIADSSLRQTIEILLNLIEELNSKVKNLEEENQKLRDENNRLKGEEGKPDIKANKTSGFKKDHSSEKERKTSTQRTKSSKNANIQIDRERILEYPKSELPPDAEFKGYEDVIVQDISLQTDNVLFRKQKYYSAEQGKTYLASLPFGYDGEFGPGVKALVMSTKAWDIFMSLVATTRKLGISFFKYMQDRISQNCEIPSLGTIIRDKCFLIHQPNSWQEELFCMSG